MWARSDASRTCEPSGTWCIIYAMHNHVREIRRYTNRKMYDTVAKSFVTLSEVLAMVRRGVRVVVVERATGRDITPLILARALAKEAEELARRAATAGYEELTKLTAELRELMERVKKLREVIDGSLQGEPT